MARCIHPHPVTQQCGSTTEVGIHSVFFGLIPEEFVYIELDSVGFDCTDWQ